MGGARIKQSIAAVAVLLAQLASAEEASITDCPLLPFDRGAQVTPALQLAPIEHRRTSNSDIPIEISIIREGAISQFVGISVNDGIVSWYGFDLQRRVFVAVLGYAGPRLDQLPD